MTLKNERIFCKDQHFDSKFQNIIEDEKMKKKQKTFQSNLALYLETRRKDILDSARKGNLIPEIEQNPTQSDPDQTAEQDQNEEDMVIMSPTSIKKISRKDRSRAGSISSNGPSKKVSTKPQQMDDDVKTPLFSSAKQLYIDVNSKEFQPEISYNQYAKMDPKSENFTPRYSINQQFAFGGKRIQAFSCAVSKIPSLQEMPLNGGEGSARIQVSPSKLLEKMSKEKSAPPSDREVRHKRSSYTKIQEREKFHLKIDTVCSTREAGKTANNLQNQFYNQKLNHSVRNISSARTPFSALISPKYEEPTPTMAQTQTQNFYQDFQKLKGVCKKNIRRTVSMKKNIKLTFAGLQKKLKKMDDLITDRDVKFEAQILKDIKYNFK